MIIIIALYPLENPFAEAMASATKAGAKAPALHENQFIFICVHLRKCAAGA
jgi:hypothetical protein